MESKKMDNKRLTTNTPHVLVPTSFDELCRWASYLAKSGLVPKNYQGKPEDIVVAIQRGAEVGLLPLQSLDSIKVINGTPSLWGDGALAVVLVHPLYEAHEEYFEGEGDNKRAVCRIKRKGAEWYEKDFSVKDAKLAGLWGKPGTWTTYPTRMLQMRARGFAIRDKFADALKGMKTAEELQDYPEEAQNYPSSQGMREVSHVEEVVDIKEETEKNAITDLPCWDDGETNSHLSIAAELIEKYSIPQKTVDNWCEKANIKSLVEADDELLIKFIEGIKKKYE